MNKGDLIDVVSSQTGFTKADTQVLIDSVGNAISDALGAGKNVTLVGFGTFKTAKRKARRGQNPRTGEKIDIPATTVPKFLPGAALKNKVSGS